MTNSDQWYGVYNRKGELEAVESSFDAATIAGLNLSLPDTKSTRRVYSVHIYPVIENEAPNENLRTKPDTT